MTKDYKFKIKVNSLFPVTTCNDATHNLKLKVPIYYMSVKYFPLVSNSINFTPLEID